MSHSDFDPQNQRMDSKIIASLERIAQAFRVLLWTESKEHALSPIQVQVLIFLLHHSEEKRKVSYLASEFNMTKATISDTVKSLEQKGLISKEYTERDTRSYAIRLSDKGKDIASQTSLFTRELRAPLDELDAGDKENLLLSLIGIIRHLNRVGVITPQRMCFTCSHYRPGSGGQGHFCQLLNQSLAPTELRVDCAEHVPV
ncbi:MarR family winged helix-turn-helix transcriptional regulator [Parapedobacter soli]|uniref:MarR family winged helix-turn-helix transcriptional regulator n=1 Tax=Parapedobacter soli TaxID=416955 RepID=UPI0021C8F609|nr:MarR family winged helix-turn-helix transcriptional regulator [Parapedobacter soli]